MNCPRTRIAVAILLASVAASSDGVAAPRPAERVFVIMLDGTRPDILRMSRAPNLAGLAAHGATFTQARTTYPSQTRVSFVTLPTGAYPGHHGIIGGDDAKDAQWRTIPMGNDDPIAAQSLVARHTIFEEATAAGLTSLYAAMKGYELVGARGATWTINGKNTLDRVAWEHRYVADVGGSSDLAAGYKLALSRQLLDQVLEVVRKHRPNLVVMNLGSVDYTGHAFGPRSPRYQAAIEFVDGLVGDLLRELERLGLREGTAFVVSADHGFSDVDGTRPVTADAEKEGLPPLKAAGIEHFAVNTGGASVGVYIRDKARVAEAAGILRRASWCEAIYCEDARAGCDRSLHDLGSYFPDRSPDLMVDIDDDATLDHQPQPGQHGSLRDSDMRIPLILSGAGIARGLVLGKASLIDVAPTALRLLGLKPTVMKPDGRILEEALQEGDVNVRAEASVSAR